MDRAISIARAVGLPLKIAAKVDRVDADYFREVIAPLLDAPGVEFIGEIDETEKTRFLGEAVGLLFPIDWPEPFGLVMIEAMACGTPVLAFRNGSVPEVVDEGITGCIVESMPEACRAISRLTSLDRRGVRRRFDERFSAARMASDYVSVYKALVNAFDEGDAQLKGAGQLLRPARDRTSAHLAVAPDEAVSLKRSGVR